MSCAPQPTSTTGTTAWSSLLQVALAALAVCVLYWAVGINDTTAAASDDSSVTVHVQHVANTAVHP